MAEAQGLFWEELTTSCCVNTGMQEACTPLLYTKEVIIAADFWLPITRIRLYFLKTMTNKAINNRNNCEVLSATHVSGCYLINTTKKKSPRLTIAWARWHRGPKVLKLQHWIKSRIMMMPQWYKEKTRKLFFQVERVSERSRTPLLTMSLGYDLSS